MQNYSSFYSLQKWKYQPYSANYNRLFDYPLIILKERYFYILFSFY